MKSIRKAVIISLSFLLLFSATARVHSQGNNGVAEIALVLDKESVYTNQTFNVSIVVRAEGIKVVQCRVEFNQTLLRVVEVRNGEMFDDIMMVPGIGINNVTGIDNEAGLVGDIIGYSSSPINASDGMVFANISFNVIGDISHISGINLVNEYCYLPPYESPTNLTLRNAVVKINPVSIKIEPEHQLVGNDTAEFYVNITPNGNEIVAMNVTPFFDPNYLEIINITNGDLFPMFFTTQSWDIIGTVTNPTQGITNNGSLAIIKFKPKQSGLSLIDLTNITIVGVKNNQNYPLCYIVQNATLEADLIPPEVNITSLSPSVLINNTTYVKTPLTVNATIMDDNLIEVMFLVIDNKTSQFLYGKDIIYENYSNPPSKYSETWEYLFNLTNGTIWENYLTTIYTVSEHGEFLMCYGLYNETGGQPETPVIASFNTTTYEFMSFHPSVNFTYGVSTFRARNMVSTEDGPSFVNASNIFVITQDFRLVPTTPPEKDYMVFWRGADIAENEGVDWRNVTLDNTPPSIEKTVGEPSVAYGGAYYVTTSTPITLTAEDTGVGLASLQYRIWNGTWTKWMTYEEPITFSEACTHYLEINATDLLGNSIIDNETFYVDITPPSIEKTVGEPNVAYGDAYYVTTSTQIVISAIDAGCNEGVGLASLQYRIWNGTWTKWMTYEEPITFSEACTHYLEINATDLLGNVAYDNETFYVDITPSSIEKTVGEPNVAYGDGKYYVTTSTPITVTATDAGCNGGVGLDSIQYRIWYNGWSDWVDYEAAITFTGECIHYLEIKATDLLGNVAYDNETFSVDKTPPTSTSQLSGTKEGNVYTTNVYISISSSDAKSGVKYTKYRIDGDAWQTYVGAFTVTSEGTHTLQFYSVDKLGNTETTQTKTFEILKNKAPTASFTYSPAKPKDTQSVNFDASASSDPDGTIANYTWNFGDGSVGYGKNPSHKYADNGNYTVTLTVKDDKGATDVATKQIEVLNEAPEAYFTHQPDEPKVNEEVTFTDASSDTDGSIVNWTWDFGDGNVSYGQNPTHKYDKSGTYTVKLTVKDNDGATDERTFDITVKKEKVEYLLPLIAIIILVIIAIILVAIWKRRAKKEE